MITRFSTSLLLLAPLVAHADDWPQWHGADRTNISKETGLLQDIPKTGPRVHWKFDKLGIGYSGPAIVGDTLFILGGDEKDKTIAEFAVALDVKSGQEKWRVSTAEAYNTKKFLDGWGTGPRSTPTVDGDRVYVLSASGELSCLKTSDGSKVWSVNFEKDFGGKVPQWGFSESVLIDGDWVVCTPGGAQGTIAALDKRSGKVVWRSTELKDNAAYSSIIIATVGGVKHYITMTPNGVVGVRADDGKLLYKSDIAKNNIAVIPTPIFADDHVFATSGYGSGCGLLKLTADNTGGITAKEVYRNKNMINHHGGVIKIGDFVYGYSDGKGWVCIDFKKGENVWDSKEHGKGTLTYADGRFFCLDEGKGTIAVIKADTSGWKRLALFPIPEQTKIRKPQGRIWTHIVISNGKMYLRDQDLLFCLDLREGSL